MAGGSEGPFDHFVGGILEFDHFVGGASSFVHFAGELVRLTSRRKVDIWVTSTSVRGGDLTFRPLHGGTS